MDDEKNILSPKILEELDVLLGAAEGRAGDLPERDAKLVCDFLRQRVVGTEAENVGIHERDYTMSCLMVLFVE